MALQQAYLSVESNHSQHWLRTNFSLKEHENKIYAISMSVFLHFREDRQEQGSLKLADDKSTLSTTKKKKKWAELLDCSLPGLPDSHFKIRGK